MVRSIARTTSMSILATISMATASPGLVILSWKLYMMSKRTIRMKTTSTESTEAMTENSLSFQVSVNLLILGLFGFIEEQGTLQM